ncbi:CocE/NonD family hydrolase [Sphingomonas sp. RB3P16]|uniref:CocE/NonD family hydrolase n=1 Tax=Parasphingomonas frigoris TaxID=3096163 RepID=UPI002FCC2B0D
MDLLTRKYTTMHMVRTVFAFCLFAFCAEPVLAVPPQPEPAAIRNASFYIPMRDGVRLAVDLWLPVTMPQSSQVPTVMETTRYWRASRKGPKGNATQRALNDRGYAYIIIDARGSGASFGNRRMEWAPEEVADLKNIVEWIVSQPWSNGKVGGVGTSYSGNTAELLAATGHPAVKAVAPLFSDFDPASFWPGGVRVSGFVDAWVAANAALDANDMCALAKLAKSPCFLAKAFVGGVKPVDGPDGDKLLAEALADHRANADLGRSIAQAEFSDDKGPSGLGVSDVAPYRYRAAIEAAAVPMLVYAGWMDGASAAGAIARFNSFSNVQKVYIGAWSHGGQFDTDPFKPKKAPANPDKTAQQDTVLRFFDCYLKDVQPNPTDRLCSADKSIAFYTMGEGQWHTTGQWPIQSADIKRFQMTPETGLELGSVAQRASATLRYRIDFDTTTGSSNRWATQNGEGDVVYDNRTAQSAKMLSFTSAPLTTDADVTGHPVVKLKLSTDRPDGVVHAYLEDVAPDGRVTYLTEGVLRLSRRKVSTSAPPYWQAGPFQTLARADHAPMVQGQWEDVSLVMFPLSARIKTGHRIRVSISGADKGVYQDALPPCGCWFDLQVGGADLSYVDLPFHAFAG